MEYLHQLGNQEHDSQHADQRDIKHIPGDQVRPHHTVHHVVNRGGHHDIERDVSRNPGNDNEEQALDFEQPGQFFQKGLLFNFLHILFFSLGEADPAGDRHHDTRDPDHDHITQSSVFTAEEGNQGQREGSGKSRENSHDHRVSVDHPRSFGRLIGYRINQGAAGNLNACTEHTIKDVEYSSPDDLAVITEVGAGKQQYNHDCQDGRNEQEIRTIFAPFGFGAIRNGSHHGIVDRVPDRGNDHDNTGGSGRDAERVCQEDHQI